MFLQLQIVARPTVLGRANTEEKVAFVLHYMPFVFVFHMAITIPFPRKIILAKMTCTLILKKLFQALFCHCLHLQALDGQLLEWKMTEKKIKVQPRQFTLLLCAPGISLCLLICTKCMGGCQW